MCYADMVAELFHYGHLEFLKQACDLGGLIVCVVEDNDAVDGKRHPILNDEERVKVMAA